MLSLARIFLLTNQRLVTFIVTSGALEMIVHHADGGTLVASLA